MIKNNESLVEITSRNIKYYSDRGYLCEIGNIISINVLEMPKMSKNIIIAICEVCYKESNLSYSKYNKNIERGGFYSCRECSNIKRKKTNLSKYGVEYIGQLEDNKERNRKWMSSEEFKEKSKNSLFYKYGVESYSKTNEFKTSLSILQKEIVNDKKNKGLYTCNLSNPENNKLKIDGMLRKYGEKYSFLVPKIKKKIQNKNLEKFGHISPFGNEEIQKDIKSNKIYKISQCETSFNGYVYNKDLFKIYRRKVRYKTNLLRVKIFENWDGYDYYDNEYIKDNLYLNVNNINYPTIDHKISCFYGFINNLDADYISDISNLCITKRFLNNKKHTLNESEFIDKNIF
jgi:hypothetical protein